MMKKFILALTAAAVIALRIIDATYCELMRRGLSVHPAANNPPWRHNNGATTDDGPCDDGGTAGSDAARTNYAASTDDGVCFHGAQGDEARCQRQRNNQIFHDGLLGL